MRASVAILVALGLCLAGLRPASAQTWSRLYDGIDGESAHALGETASGDLVVAAFTDSFGTATGDGWFLRLAAADGSVLDENVAGDPDNGGVDGAHVASDGGALFVGRNVVNIFTKHDAWAMRMDANGDVQWGRLLAWVGFGRTFLYDADEAVGGGWFVAGTSGMNDTPPQNAWLVKLDDMGNVTWQQEHGSGTADTPRSIVATADGGLIAAGTTTFGGDEDVLLVKYDSAGSISWQWQLGGDSTDQAEEVIVLSSGGYAVAGNTQSFTASGRAPWLMRFDGSGNLLWHRVFGDQEWGDLQALVETADGDIVALGRISEPGFPTNDLWAVKCAESDGAVEWQRAYEGDSGDYGDQIIELSSGDLLMAGTWGWGFPEEAIWLLRTTADGQLPGCDFVRDTTIATSSPRVVPVAGPLSLLPPEANNLVQAFEENAGGAVVTDPCSTGPCAALSCDSITVMPVPACEGDDVTVFAEITGGEGALQVLWDVLPDPDIDAMGNPAVLSLGPGTHQVAAIVTDSCGNPMPQGCNMMTTITVHPDMTPTIVTNGPTSFCAAMGESVTLDAGPGYVSYQWALDGMDLPGADGQTFVASSTGDYTVTVVDLNGCTWTSAPTSVDAEACGACAPLSCDSVDIVPEPACAGEQQVFTAVGTGGEGTLRFDWDFDGDGLTDVTGNPAAWTFPEGSWPVTLTVTDACASPAPQSCQLMTTATVHPDQTPVIAPDGPTEYCESAGGSLTLDAGGGYASHEWFLDGAPIPMSDQQAIPAPVSGSYSVTVIDANGCTWTSASVVVVADACDCATPLSCDDLIVDPPTACEGESQSFRIVYGGGLGPYQVTWDFDEDGLDDAAGNPVDWTLPAGTTRVAATVVDTGCPGPGCTLELDVLVNPGPSVGVTPDGPISFCADLGESVTLTADPGFASYQWTLNDVDLPGEVTDTLGVSQSGAYAVRVVDANGCTGSSAAVDVVATDCGAPCAVLTCDDILVEPGPPCNERLYTLTLVATGGEGILDIEWDVDGDGMPDAFGSPVQLLLDPGIQTVEVKASDQCTNPGVQECGLMEVVDVPADPPPPGEVSDVPGGEPPLLVEDAGDTLVFEEEPGALAYDLHVGALGSWYGPRLRTDCHRTDVVSRPDGSVSLVADLPTDSWVVVTASDACSEGTAGTDSFGTPRDADLGWEPCGPLP